MSSSGNRPWQPQKSSNSFAEAAKSSGAAVLKLSPSEENYGQKKAGLEFEQQAFQKLAQQHSITLVESQPEIVVDGTPRYPDAVVRENGQQHIVDFKIGRNMTQSVGQLKAYRKIGQFRGDDISSVTVWTKHGSQEIDIASLTEVENAPQAGDTPLRVRSHSMPGALPFAEAGAWRSDRIDGMSAQLAAAKYFPASQAPAHSSHSARPAASKPFDDIAKKKRTATTTQMVDAHAASAVIAASSASAAELPFISKVDASADASSIRRHEPDEGRIKRQKHSAPGMPQSPAPFDLSNLFGAADLPPVAPAAAAAAKNTVPPWHPASSNPFANPGGRPMPPISLPTPFAAFMTTAATPSRPTPAPAQPSPQSNSSAVPSALFSIFRPAPDSGQRAPLTTPQPQRSFLSPNASPRMQGERQPKMTIAQAYSYK